MKRVHLRWHRLIWGALLPMLLALWTALYWARPAPPAPEELPRAVVNTPAEPS